MRPRFTHLFVFIGMVLFHLPSLSAQSVGTGSAQPDSATTSETFSLDTRKQEVRLFLDKIDILGRVDKPQTVFIVQGQDPDVDDIQIDRSFFKEIFRPVERDAILKIAKQSRKPAGPN